MAAKIVLPPEPLPRYHARLRGAQPHTVIARLAVLSPERWQEAEAYLLSKDFTPYRETPSNFPFFACRYGH